MWHFFSISNFFKQKLKIFFGISRKYFWKFNNRLALFSIFYSMCHRWLPFGLIPRRCLVIQFWWISGLVLFFIVLSETNDRNWWFFVFFPHSHCIFREPVLFPCGFAQANNYFFIPPTVIPRNLHQTPGNTNFK